MPNVDLIVYIIYSVDKIDYFVPFHGLTNWHSGVIFSLPEPLGSGVWGMGKRNKDDMAIAIAFVWLESIGWNSAEVFLSLLY